MKLIKPSVEVIPQEDIFKHIELCGRVCYKSEDRITEDSSKKFVSSLIKSGHTSVLEQGTVYLKVDANDFMCEDEFNTAYKILQKYLNNPYSVVKEINNFGFVDCHNDWLCAGRIPNNYAIYVTTNYRVLLENNWLDDLEKQCKPTKYHEKRVSVKFICDRGISHELVRHRVFSFSQESTRQMAA